MTLSMLQQAKSLPSDALIPRIGLGVYQSQPGAQTYDAVKSALALGYRHIDTAQIYQNEADVGKAVADSRIPRHEIFITSKLWISNFGYEKAIKAIKKSNDLLGGKYIDLMLLHAPGEPQLRAETWRAMEHLRAEGVIRDIGVSNFGQNHLEKLAETEKVKPCINQIEVHPWLQRRELVAFCRAQGILVEAYSPLAKATKLSDPVVLQVAKELGSNVSTAQVLIAWSLAKDFITLPKSVHAERQKQNLDAAKLQLTPQQIAKLDALEEYLVTGWDPVTSHPV